MLIRTSKYNYYHIRADGAQKLPACIYNFSGRIYMANHRQVHCKQNKPNGTGQCHKPSAHPLAPKGKLAAWNTVTVHIFIGNSFILPSLKQVSFLKTGGHPICRHNTPSRTLKIHEIWLSLLDEGSTRGQRSNPASRRPVANKTKH